MVILLSMTLSLTGQTLRYDVIKGSKKLGEMIVKREINGNVEEISFESDVTFRILFAFTLKFSQYEKFNGDKLNWGKALNQLNGRTQKDSKIVNSAEGQILTLDGVTVKIQEPIKYSVSQIYYYEPKNGQQVFSQQFGQFLTFRKVSEHRYVLPSPDGDNYYTYRNGICILVDVERDFANFYFELQAADLKAVDAKADSLYVTPN
jgi:hypothetical protein